MLSKSLWTKVMYNVHNFRKEDENDSYAGIEWVFMIQTDLKLHEAANLLDAQSVGVKVIEYEHQVLTTKLHVEHISMEIQLSHKNL